MAFCRSVTVVTLVLLAIGLTRSICQAKYVLTLQSFDELVQECAELLSYDPSILDTLRYGTLRDDTETKCLVRCVGLAGRFWSDDAGLRKNMLARYFNAAIGDTANVNRTQTCLDGLGLGELPGRKACDLAYESFLCFYHNFGNLHRYRVFVPLDNMQLLHVTARCMEVLAITVEDLMCLTADELDENRSVHCLVRCIGIQTGMYSDWDGVNVDLIYLQFGEGHDERKYKDDAYACLMRHTENGTSPCRTAYNMLYKCFENVRNVITEFEIPDSDECG